MSDVRRRKVAPMAEPEANPPPQQRAGVAKDTRDGAASPQRHWVAGLFYTRNERLWNVARLTGRVLSSTIGLIILLALFTLIGAVVFIAIEAPHENAVRNNVNKSRQELLESLWQLVSEGDSLTREAFMNVTKHKLNAFSKELVEATSSGINTEEESIKKWTFWGGVFYSLTVYTTIGYGNIAPSTDSGRIATMIYAVIGIPLCLVVLVKVGKVFTRVLKVTASLMRRTYRRVKAFVCRCRKPKATEPEAPAAPPVVKQEVTELADRPEDADSNASSFQPDLGQLVELYEQQDSSFDVPIVAALVLVIVYMLLGAVLYRQWEAWDYTEAVYFIFISISTIGFGDVLPEHPKFFLLVSVYIFVGLSFISMVVNLLMDAMAEKLDEAQDKIRELAMKTEEEEAAAAAAAAAAAGSGQQAMEAVSARPSVRKASPPPQRVDKVDLSCLPSCTRAEN